MFVGEVKAYEKEAMKGEDRGQVKISIGIELLWETLFKDLSSIVPIVMPNFVTEGTVLKGDGGLGTVYHFKFGPGLANMREQKEEVVEFDENLHLIGLQVIEGGRLGVGFTYYKNTFQLTKIGESETLVDSTVDYETGSEETSVAPGELVKSAIAFARDVEAYLLKKGQSFPEK